MPAARKEEQRMVVPSSPSPSSSAHGRVLPTVKVFPIVNLIYAIPQKHGPLLASCQILGPVLLTTPPAASSFPALDYAKYLAQ